MSMYICKHRTQLNSVSFILFRPPVAATDSLSEFVYFCVFSVFKRPTQLHFCWSYVCVRNIKIVLTINKLLIYGQMSLSTIAALLKTACGLDTFKVDVG